MSKPKKQPVVKTRADKIKLLAYKTRKTLKEEGPVNLAKKTSIFLARYSRLNRLFAGRAAMHVNPFIIQKWYRLHSKKITVVIPSYNDYPYLKKCVASIRKTTKQSKVDIVVVDDFCQAANRERLKKLEAYGVKLVFRKQNGGFAKAVNSGMKAVKRGDIVLINSDVVAKKGWLEALQYGAYKFESKAGLVGAKLLYPDGTIQYAGSHRNTDAPGWFDHYYRFRPTNYGPANVPWPVIGVTGACMYIKRAVIYKIGYMDEKFGMAFEDMDYSLRAWQAGFECLYFPSATLIHHESKTRGKEQGQRELKAKTYFWKKWNGFFDKRNVRTKDGKIKIIFVLQTTGMSGGIRIVVEHINRLINTGKFDVELFSIDEYQNAWPLHPNARHRAFKDYADLQKALVKEEAIKVATWWETNRPVWRASVKKGIPVFFVQEVESSFYSKDPVMQNTVLASYRKEPRYMTTSQYNKQEIAERLQHTATAIPCGIDLGVYRPLKNVKRHENVLLAVGRTEPLKNFPMTLKAWEAMDPQPELWLYGVQPEVVKPRQNLTYHFKPSDAEVNKLFNQATAFVQTSRHEGFCLTALEAMAAGCPVVMTDSHGNRDYFEDGKNCLIVEQDNVEELVNKLQLLFLDTKLQQKLRQAGYKTAARYDWPKIGDKLKEFYTKVADEKTSLI